MDVGQNGDMPPHPMTRRGVAAGTAALVLVLGAACSSEPSSPTAATDPDGTSGPETPGSTGTTGEPAGTGTNGTGTATVPVSTPPATPTSQAGPTVLLSGLDVPWSIAPLPDGRTLISERNTGDVHLLPAGGLRATVVGRLPIHRETGEGGLLGLAVPPDFTSSRVIYAYYTSDSDNRIAEVPFDGRRLGEPEVIFSGIPSGRFHNGGRIAFGPDGQLYVGTGEAGDRSLSQNLRSFGGKILRITRDGSPAPGNPFGGSPIWTLGHRNVQGLAWDSQGRMWASEFGASTWDELNLIRAGQNYGWPRVEGRGDDEDYVDPVTQWPTSEMSPSGIAVGPDDAVYLAALRGESVWRVPIAADGTAGTPTRHLQGTYGRIRDIRLVDGRAWILTSNGRNDRLVSLPMSAIGGR